MTMKFKNTVEDIEIWMEYRVFEIISFRIFKFVIYLIAILHPIFLMIKSLNKDNYIYPRIISLSIIILGTIIELIITIYILFSLLPKWIRYVLKKESNKLFKKKKIFHCEKEVIIEEKGIKVICANKEYKIMLKKNTRFNEYKEHIFITEVIMKNKPIKIYPIIIPVEIFNKEKIKFTNELKFKILNEN
jgi:hypothetical protein